MAEHVLRDDSLTIQRPSARKNAWVNLALKAKIYAMPCSVCGRADDIECDHIVGIADGGDSRPSNIQPLCRTCNMLKRHHKTNDAVAGWILANPEKFAHRQRERTKRLELIARGEWF